MSEKFQYTGEKYEWTGDQKEFVTFVLAAGRGYHDIDELAEYYLKAIELDLSPYKDFREMRLAYEPGIDVDAYLAMIKEKYKDRPDDEAKATDTGGTNGRYSPEEKMNMLNWADDRGIFIEDWENWKTPRPFIKIPESDRGNITWQGTLVEFMALIILCEKYGVMAQTKPVEARAAICIRLREFVDVDFGHFTDFQSLYDAHHQDFDVRATRHKAYRVKKARHLFYNSLSPERKTKMTAFMIQASFDVETAHEFALRWPALNEQKLYQIFDLLFIPDELIAEQLGHRVCK